MRVGEADKTGTLVYIKKREGAGCAGPLIGGQLASDHRPIACCKMNCYITTQSLQGFPLSLCRSCVNWGAAGAV